MRDREPTTVLVTRIDFASTIVDATKTINDDPERYGIKDAEGKELRATLPFTWGFVETSEGMFVLCDEGVGDAEPKDKFTFEISYETIENEKTSSFSLFPIASITLTTDEIRNKAAEGDRVPLHEFIRSFGGRLEANYSSWLHALEPIALKLEEPVA